MRRDILQHHRHKDISGCCPGHDAWPVECYRNNRSKRARSKCIKREHRNARRVSKMKLMKEVKDE